MRVDALRDVAAGMAEDAAFCCLIGIGIIKQRRYRVPAVMSCVPIGADVMHDRPPKGAVPSIVIRLSCLITNKRIAWAGHSQLNKRCDAVMDGDDAETGGGLALCDADIALSEMDIRFL